MSLRYWDRLKLVITQSRWRICQLGAAIALASAQFGAIGCSSPPASSNTKAIEPVYDTLTGKLTLLKYDADGDGRVDTWSHMDGNRVLRIEIDTDRNGRIDRWEHYGEGQKLEKVGFSRGNDGKEDAWSYAGPDGSIVRIEVSTRRDGRVSRVEHYEKEAMVAAEEDDDGDGRIDRWETYEQSNLVSLAFDTLHRGVPDRRLVYGANGTARLEVDTRGDGHFVAAPGNNDNNDNNDPAAPRPPLRK